jgi:hypothetical protein
VTFTQFIDLSLEQPVAEFPLCPFSLQLLFLFLHFSSHSSHSTTTITTITGVSCSADRQAKAKITEEGIFLEQLETNVAQYLPDVTEEHLGGSAAEAVKVSECGYACC